MHGSGMSNVARYPRSLYIGLMLLVFLGLAQIYTSENTACKSTFKQDLIGANGNLRPVSQHSGRLEMYGLADRHPKDARRKAKVVRTHPNLVSAAAFDPATGAATFKVDESLSSHIYETINEHQRFITQKVIHLRRSLAEIAAGSDQTAKLDAELKYLSLHANEVARVLRQEVMELRTRLGHSGRSQQILTDLALEVRAGIEMRQNYTCDKSIRCDITDRFGFASGIHVVLWCLVKGSLEDKRVILGTEQWRYTPREAPWEKFFQPMGMRVGEKCDGVVPHAKGESSLFEVPKHIAEALVNHHTNPYAWWLAQFMGYIMRPSNFTLNLLEREKRRLDFTSPIVGVHIRRTDKLIREGGFHSVEEYMAQVEEFFRTRNDSNAVKKVFVATDDPVVIEELRVKFPGYKFIFNTNSSCQANDLKTRYSKGALENLTVDLFLLSMADKTVCTFSSGVCRVAYELMLARDPGATGSVVSLDVAYYFSYKLSPPRVAMYAHEPVEPSEMYLDVGDCVELPYPRFVDREAHEKISYDGFSIGIVCGSKSANFGEYPTYKTLPTMSAVSATIG